MKPVKEGSSIEKTGNKTSEFKDVKEIAAEINTELRSLRIQRNWSTVSIRRIMRRYAWILEQATPEFILGVTRELIWGRFILITEHQATTESIGEAELEELGQGINSWGSVDTFACHLAGPLWLNRQVPDELFHRWAHSADRWWRRAALVSTVALNTRSQGGNGDVPRTLQVCRYLAGDHDDMVVKALSWALRALVVHDPDAVRRFLAEYDEVLAARVKREVTNKLKTGLKNPGKGK